MEVEVAGSPQQVWDAIATARGISAWFVPTEVDEREGGTAMFHLGPGMDAPATVTAWEPPRRFVYEEPDWREGAPEGSVLASEWLVEAKSGDACVVRLVSSFSGGGDWGDGVRESLEKGWTEFFVHLRLYLARFAGQECAGFRIFGEYEGGPQAAFDRLVDAADVTQDGERSAVTLAGASFAGTTEHRDADILILALDDGYLDLGAFAWEGVTRVVVATSLFGAGASQRARDAEVAVQDWVDAHFPARAVA